jgi:hypothetical protein
MVIGAGMFTIETAAATCIEMTADLAMCASIPDTMSRILFEAEKYQIQTDEL